jgi:polyhydroxyalkanoate synthesis regulator phasin
MKIIDNATDRDITIPVLSNLIGRDPRDLKKTGLKAMRMILKKGGLDFMDMFKKLTLASIGAVNLTREKVEEMFDELVKKGEMTEDERARAVKSFIDRTVESSEKARKWTEETFHNLSSKFSLRFNEQIGQLSNRIEQLNARLSEIERKLDKQE